VTPEAEERLAKSKRFLAEAEMLSPGIAPEAVIHVAYYAMLHAAAAVLVARQGRAPKTHGGVISQFSQLTKDEGQYARSISRAFNRAEDIRLRADYSYSEDPDATDALEVRKSAIEFVAYCQLLLQSD
jgi:uncharacterized protein (UPF0332 family)